jgi:hypothetical protein
LVYVFADEENVNVKLVEKGLANVYVLDEKRYEGELRKAWEICINGNKNLCEKSVDKCSDCIELIRFENQEVIFYNKCGFDCKLSDWTIKDEGRKKFVFPDFVLGNGRKVNLIVGEGIDNSEILFWEGEDYVWTDTGDTLFFRDNKGKLVL